jgi:hypothetical protein
MFKVARGVLLYGYFFYPYMPEDKTNSGVFARPR